MTSSQYFPKAERNSLNMSKKEIKERMKNIEDQFFDIDHENKKALFRLEFDKVSDILNKNVLTKTPLFDAEFLRWIKGSFDAVPKKYKIDIDIRFNDMEGYKEEELQNIFLNNCLLEANIARRSLISKNKIALGLLISGVVFTIGMILLEVLWKGDDPIKIVTATIIEIAAWVTIWEALDVFLIENREKRRLKRNITKRFEEIRFRKIEK